MMIAAIKKTTKRHPVQIRARTRNGRHAMMQLLLLMMMMNIRSIAICRRHRLLFLSRWLAMFINAHHFTLKISNEQRQSFTTIAHALNMWMRRNPYNARARQLTKIIVLELLTHDPRNEIAVQTFAMQQSILDDFLGEITLKTDLNHTQNVRYQFMYILPALLLVLLRWQQHKQLMCRRITHELQIIRLILVMSRHIQRHHVLQEILANLVVREERVTIHIVQFALIGIGVIRQGQIELG
mmetsp:Transcript_570/g.1054  ORF Transcript_570/g.1054 Transcript_570/m.1054 type:complete len:240 (+) Transcript_570:161-880(+)